MANWTILFSSTKMIHICNKNYHIGICRKMSYYTILCARSKMIWPDQSKLLYSTILFAKGHPRQVIWIICNNFLRFFYCYNNSLCNNNWSVLVLNARVILKEWAGFPSFDEFSSSAPLLLRKASNII